MSRIRQWINWGHGIGERVMNAFLPLPKPSDAIFLAGSGRSGTTWLSNLITVSAGIQQIFEPLNPVWSREVRLLTGWDSSRLTPRPYYLRADSNYPAWEEFLEKVLTGQFRTVQTDRERTSYFPRHYLVKCIRANMMLGYVISRFQPSVLWLIRHPCAVVQSRLALRWRVDIADILQQDELVEDYLFSFVGEIEKINNPVEAHAFLWAVENMVAKHQLSTRPHLRVNYEALVLSPQIEISRIFAWLGLQVPSHLNKLFTRPSSQSRKDADYTSYSERLSSWQKKLSEIEQSRVLNWAYKLGILEYSKKILPENMNIKT